MNIRFYTLLASLILLASCNSNMENLSIENRKLKMENDSLSRIVEEVSKKYVFDSIAFRDIYNPDNTYKRDSEAEIEFLIVAYSPDRPYFIKYDSIDSSTGKHLNPDTLVQKNGGYKLKTTLKNEENPLWIEMNIENKYGKSKKGTLYDKIEIKN